jgi:ABC-type dipeptide/oligopeptide/nickel transport system permease subunit
VNFIFGTDDLGHSFFWVLIQGFVHSCVLGFVGVIFLICFILFIAGVSGDIYKEHGSQVFRLIQALDLVPGVIWISLVMITCGVGLSEISRFFLLTLLLAIHHLPPVYRSLRGYFVSTLKYNYIEGARAIGLTEFQILIRHIFPEVMYISYPILIQAWIQIILSEGYLSFLGIGLRPTTYSLGSLMNRGWHYFLVAPHLLLIPGGCLTAFLLLVRTKLRASLSGGPLRAQETDQ